MFIKNLSTKLLLCVAMLFPALMSAQLVSHRFGGTTEYEWAHSVQFDYDNGLLVTGGESHFYGEEDAAIFLKDPCFGGVRAAIYGAINGSREMFYCVRPYKNPILGGTGYIGVGYTDRLADLDAYIVLVRPNLTVARTWLFSGGSGRDLAQSVVVTSDDGFAVCGHTYNGTDLDMFVAKFDRNLNFQWSRRIGDNGGDERAFSIIENARKNLVVAGGTESFSLTGSEEIFMVEIDFGGNQVFSGGNPNSWVLITGEDEFAYDVVQDPNTEDYFLTGQRYNGSDMDAFLVRFNHLSGLNEMFVYDNGVSEIGRALEWDANNQQYTIVGHINGSFGGGDALLLNIDGGGNSIGGNCFEYGGPEADFFEDLHLIDLGGGPEYFAGGLTKSFSLGAGPEANFYWIYTDQVGKTGCLENDIYPHDNQEGLDVYFKEALHPWFAPTQIGEQATSFSPVTPILCTSTCKKGGAAIAMEDSHTLTLYPNPAQEQLLIQTDAAEGLAAVRILDIQGRSVQVSPVWEGQAQVEFAVSDLAPGVYFAEVRLVDGTVTRIKWVKE